MVVAVAAGAVAIAAPAYAIDPTITVNSMGSTSLHPGDSTTLKFTVGSTADMNNVNITLSSSLSDVTIKAGGCTAGTTCSFSDSIPAGGKTYTATVTVAGNPAGVGTGASKPGTITLQAANGLISNRASADFTLYGPTTSPSPTAAASVTSISGTIKDIQTGGAVVGALVELQDETNGATWSTQSNGKGQFTFRSTATKPIVPGPMVIGASKDGYGPFTRNFNSVAGQSMTLATLSMTPTGATPTATVTAQAGPAFNSVNANPADSLQANPAANNGSGSGSGFSTILIILGAVLVLAGVGAIVLILLRRREDNSDEDGDGAEAQGPNQGPAPVPAGMASQGGYRSGPADATMVARDIVPDAPTEMIQRPGVDPYADPYGAPMPPQPAYQGGYGQGYQASYDDVPTYHADQQTYADPSAGYGAGYGTGAGGYGAGYGGQPTSPATGPMSPPPPPSAPGPGFGVPPRPPAPPAVDPYAAPVQEYGNRGGGGYGQEQPAPTRAYPGPVPGRRDEPTGMYNDYDQAYDQPHAGDGGYGGGAPAGYSGQAGYSGGGYEPAGQGYGGGQPYGGQPYGGGQEYGGPGRGYDAGGQQEEYQPAPRGGYEQQPRSGGGYSPPPPQAGYPQAGGGGGYPQAGGYGQQDGYHPGGGGGEYGAPGGQSRHAATGGPQAPGYPPNPPAAGTERRSLDWLDD